MNVYVVGWDAAGPVKVGFCKDVKKRLMGLQNGNPYRLKAFFAEACPNRYFPIERHAHELLKEHAMTGEWFSCPASKASLAVRVAIAASLGDFGSIPTDELIAFSGRTAVELAIATGVAAAGAERRFLTNMHMAKFNMRPIAKRPSTRMSNAQVLDIVERHRAGASVVEIAEQRGCSRRTIYRVLHRAGVMWAEREAESCPV